MARDRLAAIRAQQQQSAQQQSIPAPPRSRSTDRDRYYGRQEQPRDFDPYAGDSGHSAPEQPYYAAQSRPQQDYQPDTGNGGWSQPAYDPRRPPRQRDYDQERDYERTRGQSRYGSISVPNVQPDYTSGGAFQRSAAPPDPNRPPVADFNPMTQSQGPYEDYSSPQPQRSQYTPVDPVRTRQRSISGGQDEPSPDQYHQHPMPTVPRGGQEQQRSRSNGPEGRQARGAVPYESMPSYDSGDYEGKASTVDLVDGANDDFEMRRRASEASAPVKKESSRGGPTIKQGDVEFEEMGEFFSEISDLQQALREANGQIQQIQGVQMRLLSLPSTEDPQAQALTNDLQHLTNDTRAFYNSIKKRIMALAQGNANLRALIAAGQSMYDLTPQDVDVRQTQVDALKERFKAAIQRYAEVEQEHRAKNRVRMERQVKTVYPNLSAQEITDVVKKAETNGGENLFSQAVLRGARTYAARGALREVESRAAELARIEQTLTELAQLFNDMATLVEAQDVQIVAIEQSAAQTDHDMEKGLDQVKKAVVSARSARKWRWWCFGIIMVIIVIVLIVVVVEVVVPLVNRRNDRNNAAAPPATTPSPAPAPQTAAAVASTPAPARASSIAAAASNAVAAAAAPSSSLRARALTIDLLD